MGWQDAPVAEESKTSSWQDAPIAGREETKKTTPPPKLSKPEPFKDTSLGGDILAGVGSGLYGAGLGVAQMGTEALNYILPGEPLQAQVEALRGEEAERRRVAGMLKEKYGEPGVTNPISVAEFGGEVAPYAAGGVLGAGRAALSRAPLSYGATALQGAGYGAAAGASAPLAGEESRAKSTAIGAGLGLVGGIATRGGIEGTRGLAKYGRNKLISRNERKALARTDPEAARLASGVEKNIEEGVRKVAPRSVSEVKTPVAQARSIRNDNEAIKNIAKMRDDITITRNGTQETGTLPKTPEELLDALSQAAEKKASAIDDIVSSGEMQNVRINTRDVIDELSKVTSEAGYTPTQVTTAQKMIGEMQNIENQGGYSVSAALRRLTGLNNDIKSVFTGQNQAGDAPEVLNIAAYKLRNALNGTLESIEGGAEFGSQRRQLGQFLDLRNRTLKEVERQANKNARGGAGIMDIIAAEQLIRGFTTGRPVKGILEYASTRATGKAMKYLNSHDRAVRNMFKTADYLVGDTRVPVRPPAFTGPPQPMVGPPVAPPAAPLAPPPVSSTSTAPLSTTYKYTK